MAQVDGAGRVVVVTGSTRGIGLGLVEAFLSRGCRVVVTGRAQGACDACARSLAARYGDARVLARACDVTDEAQVRALFLAARERFGRVDVWISNAGTSHEQRPFVDLGVDAIASVVETNLLGALVCARVALEEMRAQGFGAIYTMEGYGADGARKVGMSVYGATKRAVRYFTQSLVDETRGGPVRVGRLSPGIVVTELLVDVYKKGDPALWRRARWLFELIADRVETVCPWLAARVLADEGHGTFIAWMTVPRAVLRALQPRYWRRGLFDGLLPG